MAIANDVSPAPPSNISSSCEGAAPQVVGHPGVPAWTWRQQGTTAELFRVDIAGFRAEPTSDGYVCSIPGQARGSSPGDPAVPSVATLKLNLQGTIARIELSEVTWTEITNVMVAPVAARVRENDLLDAPASPPVFRMERHPSPAVYGADAFWPSRVAGFQEAFAGTQRLVRVECFPLQYNPVRRTVRYASSIEGRLILERGKMGDAP